MGRREDGVAQEHGAPHQRACRPHVVRGVPNAVGVVRPRRQRRRLRQAFAPFRHGHSVALDFWRVLPLLRRRDAAISESLPQRVVGGVVRAAFALIVSCCCCRCCCCCCCCCCRCCCCCCCSKSLVGTRED